MAQTTVEKTADQALVLTNIFIRDLEEMIGSNGENLQGMTLLEKQNVSGLLAKLMRAATGMIKESRALKQDAKKAAEGMSLEEKMELVINFIGNMPTAEREEIREKLGW